MWPQALQMTRDECRGILRRLELESYSQVISVFRAQGGLSEAKAKLLEELRGIFHISNERHRAEARRVANDEQLATIAEAISGPNTWQEWSREGRRPYPMLPRVAPHTALALIANNIAEETANENSKLPYPAETSEAIKEELQQIERQKTNDSSERNNYVVTSDPFKVPKIPAGTKKNLKRNISEQQPNVGAGAGKKRATSENSPQKNHHNSQRQQYPHITANSPQANNAGTPTSGHERKQQQIASAQQQQQNNQHLQKQRFFHHQQQLTKQKMAKKAAAAAAAAVAAAANTTTSTSNKRQATPAKSGRRANQKLLMEQQQQLSLKQMQLTEQQHHTLPPGPMHIDLTSQSSANSVSLTQQQLDIQFVTYATQHQPPQQIFMDEQSASASASQAQLHTLPSTNQHPTSAPPSLISPSPASSASASPQIAASKRDISKNLNKLQQMQQNQFQPNLTPATTSLPGSSSIIPSHDLQTSLGTILSSSSPSLGKSSEKSLISTTPVQKYIVEERQPGINTAPGSIVTLQNPQNSSSTSAASVASNISATHIIQVSNASGQQPQIMTLPQFSAAATKLRAVNTTLIAPGAKISPSTNKKITTVTTPLIAGTHSPINAGALHELANVASTQSQVLHIVETSQGNSNSTNSATYATPLHTPPAVIQIQNSTQGGSGATSTDISSAAGTQSKVLTTKILPLVLTSPNNQNAISNSAISSSSVIIGTSPTTTPGIVSSSVAMSSTTTTGTAIIKNLPSTVVLNTNTTNLTPVTVTGTIFSTLGAGGTVFRKPQNLIKTSVAVTSTSKSPTSASGAPHIISNVKLTPMNITTSSTGTPLCSTNATFKNVLPSTAGMRTSVKICQSSNGKVLIQPAGLVDASKMKMNTTTLPHKILTNTSATSGSATSTGGGGGQRIAIQKVQIIPAPLGSSAGATTIQTVGSNMGTKTSPLTGKSNMIFMPSSAATNVRPVTLSKMGNNILLKSSANAQIVTSPDNNSTPKTNIVVLGQSLSSPNTTPLKDALNQKLEASNSLINEDAPLDILNMPIVMEAGVGDSSAETVTVLPGNIIESNSSNTNTSATPIIVEHAQHNASSDAQQTVILGATDWEMELDQAITTAAHNNNATQYQKTTSHKQKRTISTSSSTSNSSLSLSSLTTSSSNKQKRLNNDLISIELKTKGHHHHHHHSSNANNIIVVDSFDDVIVEEHEDDMPPSSTMEHDSSAGEATGAEKHSEGQPKILDMQIYQQHDGIDGSKSQISIVGNQQTMQFGGVGEHNSEQTKAQSTAVEHHQEDEQHHEQQAECEVDAGFDETIVTEIDENTAIEYIEEDGVVAVSHLPSSSTTTTSAINASNELPATTFLTKALTGVKIASQATLNNSNHYEEEEEEEEGNTTTTDNVDSKEKITEMATATGVQQQQQKQETTKANNSGIQQVEP